MSLVKNTLDVYNGHTNGHGPSISHTTLRQPLKHRVPVCIVGGGIVGLTCALILHQEGIKVHVYERQSTLYPLPRAVVMAEDTQHLLAMAGMGVELDRHVGEVGQPDKFIWKGCDGKTITYLDMAAEGLCGYRATTCFSQPTLESALALRCESYGIPVYRDWQLDSVDEKTDRTDRAMQYTAHFTRYRKTERPYQTSLEVEADYLVSAEGCNSMIRDMFGFKEKDYGFTYDWLVIDVLPNDPTPRSDWLQLCNPHRPTTVVSGGPRRHRWEFMRLPHETIEHLTNPDTVWSFLKDFDLDPTNCEVERAVVYTFCSLNAEKYWDGGGVFLIGDAAHRMPPFIGQGANSGFRDAAALAWRLAMVIKGQAEPYPLFSSFSLERRAHVDFIIRSAIALGEPICQADPEKAKIQHAEMRKHYIATGRKPYPAFRPPLAKGGLFLPELGGGVMCMRRGRLMSRHQEGASWHLISLNPLDDKAILAKLEEIDGHALVVESGHQREYQAWMDASRAGSVLVLVRPDNYVYGFAKDKPDVSQLLQELQVALGRA